MDVGHKLQKSNIYCTQAWNNYQYFQIVINLVQTSHPINYWETLYLLLHLNFSLLKTLDFQNQMKKGFLIWRDKYSHKVLWR